MMQFKNRGEAGEILAKMLIDQIGNLDPLIVALPRGGVPVGFEVAKKLKAPLDILITRKLAAPSNPELALGALSESGETWINEDVFSMVAPSDDEWDEVKNQAHSEIKRQRLLFRNARALIEVRGRNVILVDDGLATGATLMAALASLSSQGARKVIVALPVASREGRRLVQTEADQVIVAYEPRNFQSVGQWYQDFSQVSDQEVISLLNSHTGNSEEVSIELKGVTLKGHFTIPERTKAWIIFVHGSGSSRKSPRNVQVARSLNEKGFGTLLFDLLTESESQDRSKIFDVDLLAHRLAAVTSWLKSFERFQNLPIGYFGASTGAAAALQACADFESNVYSIVSRGGRPDLADQSWKRIRCPVLLIVGERDRAVLRANIKAHEAIPGSEIEIVRNATHLFEEEGALEEVTRLAVNWFSKGLQEKTRPEILTDSGREMIKLQA